MASRVLRIAALSAWACAVATEARAQALSYGLAGGDAGWPPDRRAAIVQSMDEAVATYNRYGYFDRHLTANYNPGVPTAEGNYDGFISFGSQYNTRVALHEISHTLGTGTYGALNGGPWNANSAAGRLIQVFDGQAAVLNTGGTHFWPYGLNYDNEDGAAARERLCKLVSALRFDMGIVHDSDGDELPDDWETFHFGALGEDGGGDPDGDGVTNLHEYATDCDPARAAPVTDGRTYVLRGQITERALGVIGGSESEEAGAEQRTPDGSPSQRWTARYLGDGYFSFANLKSGLALEVPSTATTSGLPVRQATWTGEPKQQWRVTTGPGARDGYYQIANRETGRVVDGLDGAEGAPVEQYPFIGDIPQQFWSFEDVTAGPAPADAGAPAGTGGADGGLPGGGGGAPSASAGGGTNAAGGGANAAGGATSASGGASASAGASGSGGRGSSGASPGNYSGSSSAGAPGSTANGAAPDGASGGSDGCACALASSRRGSTAACSLLAGVALALLRRRRARGGRDATIPGRR